MHSRPPHTSACTRSRGGSSATGMRRRMLCRTRSSGHGGTCGGCGIPTAFDAWLHRLLVRSCADHQRRTWKTRLDVAVDAIDHRREPDEVSQLVDRDALDRAFAD